MSDFGSDTVAVPYEWYDGEWHRVNHYGYPDYPDGSLRTGATVSEFLWMFSNGGQLEEALILSEDAVSGNESAHYPELDLEQGLDLVSLDLVSPSLATMAATLAFRLKWGCVKTALAL